MQKYIFLHIWITALAEFYYYPIVDNSQIGLRSPKKKT